MAVVAATSMYFLASAKGCRSPAIALQVGSGQFGWLKSMA
jgi:hypothetical protein